MKFDIPSEFNVGGTTINVNIVDRCDNNALGNCLVAEGTLNIANICNKDMKQSESSKLNTFFHELTHCILDVMGEKELSENEKFVCTFSSFLTESIVTAKYTNK